MINTFEYQLIISIKYWTSKTFDVTLDLWQAFKYFLCIKSKNEIDMKMYNESNHSFHLYYIKYISDRPINRAN